MFDGIKLIRRKYISITEVISLSYSPYYNKLFQIFIFFTIWDEACLGTPIRSKGESKQTGAGRASLVIVIKKRQQVKAFDNRV
jgi:hypothetical protein